ncbi:hypothetical protein IGI04_013632 [Brassica rapa subsp. trilocularis]|uniref:Uncharacterized protein n=1 Tax=Brassica rapa subsp. trilocularis TaxID=1813537 RepID=A0ABQ7N9D7_BRACM|nr:hypothetical protein IGI04_013632 [Brassica rapa subsp. trilocularis]
MAVFMDLEINDALAMEICRDTSINSRDGWHSSPALARIGAQNPNDMTEETGTLDGSKVRTSQPRRSRADAEAS